MIKIGHEHLVQTGRFGLSYDKSGQLSKENGLTYGWDYKGPINGCFERKSGVGIVIGMVVEQSVWSSG